MPIFSKKNGKHDPPYRIIIQFLVCIGLVGLAAVALWPVQQAIQDGIRHIRDDLIGRVEIAIGRQIRYSSISPSIFGTFTIRNARVLGKDPGAEDILSVSRFRLSWSFWDLLRGNSKSVRLALIDRPQINLDLERDRDLLELLFSPGPDSSRLNFAEHILFRIRGGQCLIQSGKNQFRIEELNFDAHTADELISLNGRWNALVFLKPIFGEELSIRINMQVTGIYSTNFEEGNVVITIDSLSEERFQSRPLTFSCSLQNKMLSIRKLADRLPFDFFLDYGIRNGALSVRFRCDQFMPKDLLTLSGPWKGGGRWLTLAATGDASFEREREGKIRYRIDIAGGLPAGSSGTEASFTIRADGDEKLARIEEFAVSAPRIAGTAGRPSTGGGFFQGRIGFRGIAGLGPFSPRGELFLEDLSFSGDAGISARLSVNARESEIRILGETITMGRLALNALDISLVPSAGDIGFVISALRFRNRRSAEAARHDSFSLEGSMNYAARRFEASCSLNSVSVADIGELLRPFFKEPPPPVLAGLWQDISITTEVFLTTDFKRVLYNAPRMEIALDSQGGEPMMILSVSGTDTRFELSESRLVWEDAALLFSGYADYSNPLDISFSLMTHYEDLSYYVEGRVLDRKQISVQGSYGFQVYVTSTDTGAYSGYIEGREIPVPIRGLPARLSFYTSIRYNARDFWSFDVDNLEMTDIASPAGPGYLRIMGGADQDGAHFPLMYYRDSISPLSGRADFSWVQNFSGFSGTVSISETPEQQTVDERVVSESPNSSFERYLFWGSLEKNRMDFLISGARMRLGRVFDNTGNARADADLRITWDPERSYQAELTLSSLNAKFHEQDIRVSARAVLGKEDFSIRNLRFNIAGIEGIMPLFQLSFAESTAEARAEFRGAVGQGNLEGALVINASFAPVTSWLGINRAFRSFSGAAHVEILRYASAGSAKPFDIVFSRNDREFSVSGGPKDMLRLKLDKDGTFYAGLSSPFPVRGTIAGTMIDNTIDARCSDLYVDLVGLWNLLPPVPEIAFAGGFVSAQVEIRGPLTDPEFFGSARGASVRVQIPNYIAQDIRPVPFTVAIEGNEMYFGPVPATVGRGAGTITGVFRFDRWIPNIFTIDVVVPRETPVPFGFDITGFLAKGDVSGKLTFSMADMVLDITGDLLANKTELGLNSDEITQAQSIDIFALTPGPVTLDIKVTTGPAVEFLWPSSGFPILRANPAMGTVVHVTSDSVARHFSLISDVKIRSGEIFYFERSFYIRGGTLTFRENESSFDPRLTVRAEIRDRTDEGPVTIAMIVDNAPLLSFTARFESTPSLSQAEIISLLGQSFTGGQLAEAAGSSSRALLSATSDVLAQFGVVRQLERQIRNFLRLDMFSIRTQVLQNAVFSATGINPDPLDRNGRVGNYFDNTTIFLGKYIGSDLFIQSMLSLRYDENYTSTGGIRFEPDIGVELQTPFFNVRWDFIPAHPENWYVNDNSITLTWSKSF
ncbi:MAG: translocation/assembly module TamB [Treponema sp.]|nr:translocation/assembly module TamB [Treponema sp.]